MRPGGTVICAASCAEGIGSKDYADLMLSSPSMEAFERRLHDPSHFAVDQWEFQKQIQAARRARILFHTDGIPLPTLRKLRVTPVESVQQALDDALAENPAATVAVLPQGPYVIGQVADAG